MIVAVVIAFGIHSPRMLEMSHSHSSSRGVNHSHPDYQSFAKAGENESPGATHDPQKHTHWIPTSVDAPATVLTFSSPPVLQSITGRLAVVVDQRNGWQRPGDLMMRPPQVA